MTDDVDRAIEAYRAELTAEAELAKGDLEEIEDHLRTLTGELRGTGMPAAAAVAEAARRLGDPKQLAREHARVRTPFGAPLSRARAWSAAALFAPMLYSMVTGMTTPWSRTTIDLGLGLVVLAALVARVAWARAVLLGGLAFFIVASAYWAIAFPEANVPWLIWYLGIAVFVLPWRRGELTAAGRGLALQVSMYGAATLALGFWATSTHTDAFGTATTQTFSVAPEANIAMIATTIATIGALLRARWSALAGIVSSVTLIVAAVRLAPLEVRFETPLYLTIGLVGMISLGALLGAWGAWLTLRTARAGAGTLRYLRR